MTKPGEGFGFSISGGVNGYSGNPFDETDEGIFISQVPWLARGLVLHIVFCIQTKNSSQCNCAMLHRLLLVALQNKMADSQ